MKAAGLKRVFFQLIKAAIIVYVLMLAMTYFFQERVMFVQQKYVATPADVALGGFEEITLTAKDGQKITGWYKRPAAGKKLFLYLPGNAEDFSRYNEHLVRLSANGGGVFGLIYRGYGKSSGRPSEEGFYMDAEAAIDFLAKEHDQSRIIVIGRSIGTGVAVEMAKRHHLQGVVLWSPYTSIEEVAADMYWYFPVKFLQMVKNKFDSAAKIKDVTEPILIIHGEQDNLIAIGYAQKLFDLANSSKKFVKFPEYGHNFFDIERVVTEINSFMSEARQ